MSNEKEKILQMVSDGTITTDDAIKLLECLGEDVEAKADEVSGETSEAVIPTVSATEEDDKKSAGQAEENKDSQKPAEEVRPLPAVGKEAYESSYNSSNIHGFDISWKSGDIDIRVYNGDEINIVESASYEIEEEDKMQITEENGILRIKWNKSGSQSLLSTVIKMVTVGTLSKRLLIEIPAKIAEKCSIFNCTAFSSPITVYGIMAGDMKLSTVSGKVRVYNLGGVNLDISSVSGTVYAENIGADVLELNSTSSSVTLSKARARVLNISSVSGKLMITEAEVSDGNLNSTSGRIMYNGSIHSLKADTISGKIEVTSSTCPKYVDMNSTSGKMVLTIPENSGFTANYQTTSGKFHSQFPVQTSGSPKRGSAVYGTPGGNPNGKSENAVFNFSAMSGSIYLSRL